MAFSMSALDQSDTSTYLKPSTVTSDQAAPATDTDASITSARANASPRFNMILFLLCDRLKFFQNLGQAHDFLVSGEDLGREFTMGMAGFILKNTLSDNGAVTRGVSVVDEKGLLSQVHETTGIEMNEEGKIVCDNEEVQKWISPDDKVSMNMWAAYPEFLEYLAEDFKNFLSNVEEGDIKKEYLLPNIVDKLLKEGRANVKVLDTQDRWFGVTYKEDKESVQKAFEGLIKDGVYPADLWA